MRHIHKDFGAVVNYKNCGLACTDCGYEAHSGHCHNYYCKSCGTECGESGCSLHKGKPYVEASPRKTGS
jgi:hypothetical protein